MDTGLANSGLTLAGSPFLAITSLKRPWAEGRHHSFLFNRSVHCGPCVISCSYLSQSITDWAMHFSSLQEHWEIFSRQISYPQQNVQNESLKTSQFIGLADIQGLAISCFLENSAPLGYLWVTNRPNPVHSSLWQQDSSASGPFWQLISVLSELMSHHGLVPESRPSCNYAHTLPLPSCWERCFS